MALSILSSRRLPVLRSFAGVLALGFVTALSAQDRVKLHNGTVEEGRVESENYDALVFKAKKGKEEKSVRMSWTDVAEVSYGNAKEYYQAVGALTAGDVATALTRLQALSANASLRKELKPSVTLNLGLAQLRSGKPAEAAPTLLETIKANANSRHLLAAARGLAECYIAIGDAAAGTTAIDAAAAAANEASVDPGSAAAFDYFRGMLLEAKKDYSNAKIKFSLVASARSAPAGYPALGRLGVARCVAAAGNVEDAKKEFRAIIDQGGSNELLAGAWNGMADATLADGIKNRNLERLLDASFMFMRGVVEFAPGPGESSGEYERALAGAGEAFKQMAELESDAALKKQHAARGKQRLDQLRKEFPHSSHLAAAK